MKIQVTKGDIDEAYRFLIKHTRNYADRCPVACAISRITKAHCSVYRQDILIGARSISWTPKEVVEFIDRYDNILTRYMALPFEFELEI